MSEFPKKAVEAAYGWLGLGNAGEAYSELESLTPEQRHLPIVLECKISIYIHSKDWEAALGICHHLIKEYPERPNAHIHAAYCLHELGQTKEAKKTLLAGPDRLQETALFWYNMACYETQLGNLAKAKSLLQECFNRDQTYKESAAVDPDLAPLWESSPS